jgi:hypothetical protein
MPGKDEASRVINGFIEFAYANSEDEADLMKLLALGITLRIVQRDSNLIRALAGPGPGRGHKRQPDQLSIAKSEIQELQASVRSFMEWLSQSLGRNLQLEFSIKCDLAWQANLVFRHHSGDEPAVSASVREAGGAMLGRIDEMRVRFPSYMLRFLVALDEKEKSAFGNCARCGRIFFNDTNRRKLYCGLRCQNADAVDRARMKRKEG